MTTNWTVKWKYFLLRVRRSHITVKEPFERTIKSYVLEADQQLYEPLSSVSIFCLLSVAALLMQRDRL